MTAPPCDRVVMIVEDDADLRESIAEVLEDAHYRPLRAANGQEAIERLRRGPERPCIILLDIMMPVMDGWQFRALQRDDPELGTIPVIIMTAHADPRRATDGQGAAAYLPKPIDLDTLITALQRFCPAHPAAPDT